MTLVIRIQGPTASGRSAVAQLIAETLERHGFGLALHDDDRPRRPERLALALAGIAEKTPVEIVTERTRHPGDTLYVVDVQTGPKARINTLDPLLRIIDVGGGS